MGKSTPDWLRNFYPRAVKLQKDGQGRSSEKAPLSIEEITDIITFLFKEPGSNQRAAKTNLQRILKDRDLSDLLNLIHDELAHFPLKIFSFFKGIFKSKISILHMLYHRVFDSCGSNFLRELKR